MKTGRGLCVRLAALFAIACAAVWPGLGSAQVASDQDLTKELVAREIVRTALIDLRSQQMPGPGDYAVASAMLEIARSLTPDDTNLLRRLIESERAAGNETRVMQHTRELVRLDPSDTVAQLRLLSWNASQKQTVEERLAVYERYLGPEGQKAISDPAVRSRLALDAALLQRELGNEKDFVRLLSLATSLDSSNKEAAAARGGVLSGTKERPRRKSRARGESAPC